jgi:hypothetical protein
VVRRVCILSRDEKLKRRGVEGSTWSCIRAEDLGLKCSDRDSSLCLSLIMHIPPPLKTRSGSVDQK